MATDPFNPYPNLGSVRSDLSEYEHETHPDAPRDVLAEPDIIRSFRSVTWLSISLIFFLGLRLAYLQIVEGTKNRVLAEGNRIRTREIRPPRGEIRDRNGIILATTAAAYSLELYPAELPRTKSERIEELRLLEEITGQDLAEVRGSIEELGLTSLDPIILTDQIPPETALRWQLQIKDQVGVAIKKVPQRMYAAIPGLGHLIGYVGRVSADDKARWPEISTVAQVGKTGLEISYEDRLRGIVGQERIEVDARGRVERLLPEVAPQPGSTLVTTIDSRLQTSLYQHLQRLANTRQSQKAAAVVLDPQTGEILALVSLPDFDPNIFVQRDRQADRQSLLGDTNQPLLNRVIAGTYPSGSTIKPIMAAGALSDGLITPTTTLDTSAGVITIGQWQFPDWRVHGVTNVTRAIAESNDIFFYALAGGWQQITGLGPAGLERWLRAFGFGKETGIDIPGEAVGLVPDETWKRTQIGEPWYIGDSYHVGIGQGYLLATPLQLARAIATIASGRQTTPHLARALEDIDGSYLIELPFTTNNNPPAATSFETVRAGMRLTVTDGTARSLLEVPVAVAGKTGTAQFGREVDGVQQTHSWFTGFAPADNPQIAIVVLVEGGGESTDAAVPVAKAFLTDWWKIISTPNS